MMKGIYIIHGMLSAFRDDMSCLGFYGDAFTSPTVEYIMSTMLKENINLSASVLKSPKCKFTNIENSLVRRPKFKFMGVVSYLILSM